MRKQERTEGTEKKMLTTMVATPSIDGCLHGNHVDGLLAAHGLIVRAGCYYLRMDGESDIHRARSRLASIYLEDTKAEALVFIDADIGFTAQDLMLLLDDLRHVPIVGGVYAKKTDGVQHVFKRKDEGRGMKDEENGAVPASGEHPKCADLLEVEAIGTGFLGIRREVLEEVAKWRPLIHGEKKNWRLLFRGDFVRREGSEDAYDYLTEDYAFCSEAREFGFQAYLDRRIRLTHRGAKLYTA